MTDADLLVALRALRDKWDAQQKAFAEVHATLPLGWKACVEDLDDLLRRAGSPQTTPPAPDAKITRLEVIDRNDGRLLVLRPVTIDLFSYQDDGETLKVFVTAHDRTAAMRAGIAPPQAEQEKP